MNTPKQNWETRFREDFKYLYGEKFAYDTDYLKVKLFISTLLEEAIQEERVRLVGEIEKFEKEAAHLDNYSNCITDIINLIKK